MPTMSGALVPELQEFISILKWVLETSFRSSEKALHILSHLGYLPKLN